MGKRTRTESGDYHVIAKKIKKLERKLLQARRKHREKEHTSSSSSSDTSPRCSRSRASSTSSTGSTSEPVASVALRLSPQHRIEGVPMPSTSAAADATEVTNTSLPLPSHPCNDTQVPPTSATTDQVPSDSLNLISPALDEELLEILGQDPSQNKTFGKDINTDLAVRLQHIVTKGLELDIKKTLMEKYLIPANCTLLAAPLLNPEVKAAISEPILKRDISIEHNQKERASAISCMAEAITLTMLSDPKNVTLIKLLMDATKLICDNQYADSITRRTLILYSLKKDLKGQLTATKIDKMLFSEDLAETIKTAKAISRTGSEMKPVSTKQVTTKYKSTHKHLNSRGPPLNNRPRGHQRTKEPARTPYKDRPSTSLKKSSQPAPQHTRNRR